MDAGQGIFPFQNGCLKVQLGERSFRHFVISGFGITFHWKLSSVGTKGALCLENTASSVHWQKAKANYDYHNEMHFDEEEKVLSDYHGHFIMSMENDRHGLVKAGINKVLQELVSNGYLSMNEFLRIIAGIKQYRETD